MFEKLRNLLLLKVSKNFKKLNFFGICPFIEAAGYELAKNASHRLKEHIISYLLKKTKSSSYFYKRDIQIFKCSGSRNQYHRARQKSPKNYMSSRVWWNVNCMLCWTYMGAPTWHIGLLRCFLLYSRNWAICYLWRFQNNNIFLSHVIL